MSRKHRHPRSVEGGSSAPITAPTSQPTQEKMMPAPQEQTAEKSPEPSEPTVKALAQAEEENASRVLRQKQREEEIAAAQSAEPVSIIGLAAQGREALLEQMRQHAERTKPVEYVPPPRTARQMSQLEEELEAGRRTQAKAQAQQDSRPVPKPDASEGFTTPAYRPNNMVPDPMTGKLGPIKT